MTTAAAAAAFLGFCSSQAAPKLLQMRFLASANRKTQMLDPGAIPFESRRGDIFVRPHPRLHISVLELKQRPSSLGFVLFGSHQPNATHNLKRQSPGYKTVATPLSFQDV
ncbi:hypothetical protein L209DRAFT_41282 [Thermothelomyces heterothallicus CBS 203.75]